MIDVKVKLLSDTAHLPEYGSADAACCDLYADTLGIEGAPEKIYLGPGDCFKIPTGLAIQPPKGYCALVYARSGLASRKGLRPANCVGVVDEDYRGDIMVAVRNDSNEVQVIEHHDRIAQLAFVPYVQANLNVVDDLTTTERGEDGFGSTGTK